MEKPEPKKKNIDPWSTKAQGVLGDVLPVGRVEVEVAQANLWVREIRKPNLQFV